MQIRPQLILVLCSAGLATAGFAANPANNLSISLDLTQTSRQTLVPRQFLGLDDQAAWYFNPANYAGKNNTHTSSMLDLVSQMKVVHWRSGDSNFTDDDAFFNFVGATGCSGPTVDWGFTGFNVNGYAHNLDNASHLIGTAGDKSLVDCLYFGNEPDYGYEEQRDQFIPWTGHTPSTPYNKALTYYGPDNIDADTNPPSGPASVPDPTPNPGGGYKARWEYLRNAVIQQIASVDPTYFPNFSGPDSGYIASAADPEGAAFGVNGMPWTLRFAMDENSKIKQVTQHLYVGDGGATPLDPAPSALGTSLVYVYGFSSSNDPAFPLAAPFVVGDMVVYGSGTYSRGAGTLYKCIKNCQGILPTNATYWQNMELPWQPTTDYAVGTVVTYNGSTFQCVIGQKINNLPTDSSTGMWVKGDRGNYAFPGPHQIAMQIADPSNLTDWQVASDHELNTCPSWPTMRDGGTITYRMHEFSPLAGPQNGLYNCTFPNGDAADNAFVGTGSNSNCFGSALVGLEMFHWWAREGCDGVDPIAGVGQRNAPIYQAPDPKTSATNEPNDFIAQPFAYAWPAFNVGALPGTAKELWGGTAPSDNSTSGGIYVNSNGYNVTAYAAYTATDIYLTIFNKTFASDGRYNQTAMNVTVPTIKGFSPKHYRYLQLTGGTPASPTYGDSTQMTAQLGGVVIGNGNNQTALPPLTWSGQTAWSGSLPQVRAFSATIVDIQNY